MKDYKQLMTLDEAILHAEEKSQQLCGECAEEHKQLAEWLRELKASRDTIKQLAFERDKQIPKKPKRSGKYGVCPNCSKLIERYEQKHGNIEIPHCKWCGQKLNWR